MKSKPKNHSLRYLIIALVLAGGIGAWYLSIVREKPSPAVRVRPVRVVQPESADFEESFTIRAFLESDKTVTIVPLVSGTIERMDIDVGDAVRVDEVIAKIDPEPYALALTQAEASFYAAKSTFRRTQQLYEADATTVQNYDQARARYEAARSMRDLARLRLGYTAVRSPIDGVVLIRYLTGGDVASTDHPILSVGDVSDLVVRAAVPEDYYRAFYRKAEEIEVRLTVGGETYPAEIKTIGPYVSAETRTFEVVCIVGGDLSVLRPGMSARVTFVLSTREDVLSIPIEAIGYGNTLWYVEEGRAWAMKMPSASSDGKRIEIPRSHADRQFIVAGHHFLEEGSAIEIAGASQ
jgi:RND family efflux transporter MFP subunit